MKDWKAWGEQFGWELVSTHGDDAEFRVPNPDAEQGYEYANISELARANIDRAIEIAVDTAVEAACRDLCRKIGRRASDRAPTEAA